MGPWMSRFFGFSVPVFPIGEATAIGIKLGGRRFHKDLRERWSIFKTGGNANIYFNGSASQIFTKYLGESAKGTSPSAALRTQREPLDSLGSHYPEIGLAPNDLVVFDEFLPLTWLIHQFNRITDPLCSSAITAPSSLLRSHPPLCLALVLSLLQVLYLSFSLYIKTTGYMGGA